LRKINFSCFPAAAKSFWVCCLIGLQEGRAVFSKALLNQIFKILQKTMNFTFLEI